MNEKLKCFLIDQAVLKNNDWKIFKDLVVSYKPKYDESTDEVFIVITLNNFPTPKLFKLFYDYSEKNKIIFQFIINENNQNQNLICKKYLTFYGEAIINDPDFLLIIRKINIQFNENIITMFCEEREQVECLKSHEKNFLRYLSLAGFPKFSVSYELPKILPQQNNDHITQLSAEFYEEETHTFEGKIFKLNNTKKLINYNNIFITDYNSSIQCVFSKNTIFSNVRLDELTLNDWVRVECLIKKNEAFHDEIYGEILKITKILQPQKFIRVDRSNEKRTETIMHTNFSAFDGLNSPKDIVSCVKSWGWKSIAVTDFNCVQSFPEFSYLANDDFKVIYGMEANIIPKSLPIAMNAKTANFDNEEYVVFDLETNGLTPAFDEVIEFAGIKYKQGKKIDELHFLIKTQTKLSYETIALTNITNEMIKKDGISVKEAITKITNFIGDATLIAHNGIFFDVPFLNVMLMNNGLPPLKNQVIDTLRLSWALNPDNAKHNLGAMSRRYKVNYDETTAHRALADAEFLLNIWIKVLTQLEELKINNAIELNNRYADVRFRATNWHVFPAYIYAKNQKGIKTLYRLLSEMLTNKALKNPRLLMEKLIDNREDLIIVNNPVEGDLINELLVGNEENALNLIKFYDFITISPLEAYQHKTKNNESIKNKYKCLIKKIVDLCEKENKRCIASSDAYYLNPWQKKFHKVLVHTKAIGGKRHRFFDYRQKKQDIPDLYLHTTDEMIDSFSFLENKELINKIVIENSQYFTSVFEKTEPIIKKKTTFSTDEINEKLQNLTWENAKKKYGESMNEIVKNRIEYELSAIIKNGYSMIYWISHLLVDKSNRDGFLVGSRGSVGSSIVALLLNISEINPLPSHYLCPECHYFEFISKTDDGYDLGKIQCPKCKKITIFGDGHDIPFETFMGLSGEKVPDIDLNFSGLYQSKAHDYIRQEFGKEHTLRAGTITTIAEKTAFGFVKTYLEENYLNQVIREAEIQWYVSNIIGVKRSTGQHPGGIIIFPKNFSILDFTPYNYPADDFNSSWYTTHFAFEYLHDTLLKLDILGHDDPTMLKKLYELTKKDPKTIPNNDQKVLSLFSSTSSLELKPEDILNETTGAIGIPEFGTTFVRQILKVTKPTSFADLVRISGLSHGTNVWKNNAEKLLKEKKNNIKFSDVIACRDDIMIYLTKIGMSQKDAFCIMEDVRKGHQLNNHYIELMHKSGVPDWYINSCNQIKYLFPKAHAVAYVLMAWRIAWYKLYFPLAYYAAHFTYKIIEHDVETILKGEQEIKNRLVLLHKTYSQQKFALKPKEIELINTYEIAMEMLARNIHMSQISLNKSDAKEYLIDEESNSLIPPFITIPGLGEIAAESIVDARKNGEFKSIEDFKQRTKITNTHLKKFVELGVLSQLRPTNIRTLFD